MQITIELSDLELPKIITAQPNGIKRISNVTFDTLLQCINDAYEIEKKEEEPLRSRIKHETVIEVTPVLPKNLIKYGHKKAYSKETNEREEKKDIHYFFLNFPEFHSTFNYHDTQMKNVAYPNLVVFLKVSDNYITDIYVKCYKTKTLRETTELFDFPYAHVSGQQGRVCYYESKKLIDFVQLENWAYLWAAAQMGDHFYKPNTPLFKDITLREKLTLFSDFAKFDYDILNGDAMTFDKWASSLIKKTN